MHDLKKQAEAVLFAAGNRIDIGEIARLCSADTNSLKQALKELKKDYDEKNSSLMVSEEGNFWKLTVREAYMPLVQQINPHTELDKTTIETLAVIAWKAPILQSDVIKTRTNKAYDHIKELVDSGFLIKQRHGRSYILKLSQKFFEYFDLKDKNDIKERFKEFVDIDEEELKKVEEERLKEEEIKKAKEEAEEEPKQKKEQEEKTEENQTEEEHQETQVKERAEENLEQAAEQDEQEEEQETEEPIDETEEEQKPEAEEKEETDEKQEEKINKRESRKKTRN